VIGTIRRECLDYLMPPNELISHYNCGRPHSALGPGFPQPIQATVPGSNHRDRLPLATVLHGRQSSAAYIMNIARPGDCGRNDPVA
jgi:hypothetical protein